MQSIHTMLLTHPQPPADVATLARCIEATVSCSAICSVCADACLVEGDAHLLPCIKLDLDCADICRTTAAILARPTKSGPQPMQALLAACAEACRVCAQECDRHGSMHEHCRICAEACRACEEACEAMLRSFRHAGDEQSAWAMAAEAVGKQR